MKMSFLEKYGIQVNNKSLYETALTHSSYTNEHKNLDNYERLEFLGDAVLELVTSEYFYLHSDFKEGEMTKHRANYVCEKALATYAKEMGLDSEIRLGVGQIHHLNDTIVADVFEAMVGAIYLDQGFLVARKYILDIMVPYIEKETYFNMDFKTILQEYVQTDRKSLEYEVIKEYGEAHNKRFEAIVKIDNIIYGKGVGKSKKEAEQMAARDAYNRSAQ